MKLHLTHNSTLSNFPIEEVSIDAEGKQEIYKSVEVEISDTDLIAVKEGSKAVEFTKTGKIRCVDQTAKREAALAEAEEVFKKRNARKKELISKVTKGTATETEQEEFANLL